MSRSTTMRTVSFDIEYLIAWSFYLDASVVTDFHILNQFTLCYNDTSTFVTSN